MYKLLNFYLYRTCQMYVSWSVYSDAMYVYVLKKMIVDVVKLLELHETEHVPDELHNEVEWQRSEGRSLTTKNLKEKVM